MTTGRIRMRDQRAYIDGYDLSGYDRAFGPLSCVFDEGTDDAKTLNIKGTWPGNASVSPGTLNGIYDNTATSGLHAVMNGAGVSRNVMIPQGIQAAPVDNDPVFVGQFVQLGYEAGLENPVTATIPFGGLAGDSILQTYPRPWGTLIHAKAARTAVNSATGLDQLAQSLLGGYMAYQIFARNGTVTIKTQHAAVNVDGSFADLLSSGVISGSGVTAGAVKLALNATVERYIRWQIVLGTATTVTFALAFVRGIGN